MNVILLHLKNSKSWTLLKQLENNQNEIWENLGVEVISLGNYNRYYTSAQIASPKNSPSISFAAPTNSMSCSNYNLTSGSFYE